MFFRGAFSQVRLAECREDGHMYAIKIIDKKALKGKEDSLENEIRVLKRYECAQHNKMNVITVINDHISFVRLDHRNVVKLLEAYESRTCVYLVMEL